jgi:hypothetical protein
MTAALCNAEPNTQIFNLHSLNIVNLNLLKCLPRTKCGEQWKIIKVFLIVQGETCQSFYLTANMHIPCWK